jgi:HAMP domain-containing protein
MGTPEAKRVRIGHKIVGGIVMKGGTPGNSSTGSNRAQSKTLYQITALLVVLLLASGLVIFFLVGSAQKNQLQESKDKLINVEASDVATSFDLVTQAYSQQAMDIAFKSDLMKTAQAVLNKEISETQAYIDNVYKGIIDSGTLGMSYLMFINLNAPGLSQDPILLVSSDPSLIYHWDVPQYLVDAVNEGKTYLYKENGIPELGLEGEQLIIIKRMEIEAMGINLVGFYVGIKPMHEDVAAINDYYNKGMNKLILILGLSVFISILGVILISFFILNFLLRKRITEPIEELTAAAGQVMEGSLDVEIKEHPGSDFVVLERAFREMLDTLKKLFDRSMEDQ